MFHGSIVALVTPMKADGQIDYENFAQLVEWHIEAGTDAIVIAGTTGESSTLSFAEKQALLCTAIKTAGQRIPIIASTGTNSTKTTIELTTMAMENGADACLLVTPYYNKPTQEGLYQHHCAVAKAVPIPQILYNVPGRTACDMLPETVVRLAKISNIIGIKEATDQIERSQKILEQCESNFHLYSGTDAITLDIMKLGAKGVISVTANVAPVEMHQMCLAAKEENWEKATQINELLMPLHRDLFIEPNPIPVKWALEQMKRIGPEIRLPLTPLASQHHEQIRKALALWP
jgi:4-hydroxy-tetrahydrodipicolinate synthase